MTPTRKAILALYLALASVGGLAWADIYTGVTHQLSFADRFAGMPDKLNTKWLAEESLLGGMTIVVKKSPCNCDHEPPPPIAGLEDHKRVRN